MVSISLKRVETHTAPGFSLEWHATERIKLKRGKSIKEQERERERKHRRKGKKEVDLRVF